MNTRNDDLPYLNYLWVGPPRLDKSGQGKYQSDVKDVLDMAGKCENSINFYCLDEHIDYYKDIFKNNENITIKSIDQYLAEVKNSNSEMSAHANKMIEIKNELLSSSRNTIIDRVSFKDAFSLFLLACEGGYTVDTNVRPTDGKDNISFPSYDKFKCPYTGPSAECWMMYASPDALEQPRRMLESYLSNWDKVQTLVNDPDNITFSNFVRFHDEITSLTIDSIEDGLQLLNGNSNDPDWAFNMSDAVDAAAIAVPKGLPIVKTYGNTHKPEIEANNILIQQITNYQTNTSNNFNRALLNDLINKCYAIQSTSQADKYNELSRIDSIFSTIKKIDNFQKKLRNVSTHYKSKSNDPQKKMFANKISETIGNSYADLDTLLNVNPAPLKTEVTTKCNNIIDECKKNISLISQDAKTYHEEKHPISSRLFSRTRFGVGGQTSQPEGSAASPKPASPIPANTRPASPTPANTKPASPTPASPTPANTKPANTPSNQPDADRSSPRPR